MDTSGIKGFINKYWHQLVIVLILVFVLLKKDLSFQIKLKAPVGTEQLSPPAESSPAQREEKAAVDERLSEGEAVEKSTSDSESPKMDLFDFSSIKGGGKTKSRALSELAHIDEQQQRAFMERFAHVCISERKKYGIPASLIMANGLLLSQAGQRDMTRSGNNYFALPCTSDWKGRRDTYQGDCYRHYKNAWMSFRDHSLFLTTGRFAGLRQYDSDDYRTWAHQLEKAGFYEASGMGRQVIELIENYRLYELDR